MISLSIAPAAFADAAGAASWLAGQPQTNAPAMLGALLEQVEAFNTLTVAAGERFAALDVLRPVVFSVARENGRRYAYRALPLLAAEQSAFAAVARLWRACAVGYRLCLQAAGEHDAALATRAAEVAQRALSCLRLEQTAFYAAGSELAGDFWPALHALWADAERLGCTRQVVADRVLGETAESTPSGQYSMALLLHLARPYALSRAEFAAASRWFVRWRELARVQQAPAGDDAISSSVALDLASTRPVFDAAASTAVARWFSLRDIQRKMRQRLELLAGGQSPEALKLGSGLSAGECAALLKTLDYRLGHPAVVDDAAGAGSAVLVAVGIEACHQRLGGVQRSDGSPSASSFASQLAAQQLAVFGHVVRESAARPERSGEAWRLLARERDSGYLQLLRPPGSGARLPRRGVLMLRLAPGDDDRLAVVHEVRCCADGSLRVVARPQAGRPTPVLAEVRDRNTMQALRYPAIVVAAASGIGAPQLFIAAGLAPQTTPIRFYGVDGEPLSALRVDTCVDRGDDCERWAVAL